MAGEIRAFCMQVLGFGLCGTSTYTVARMLQVVASKAL